MHVYTHTHKYLSIYHLPTYLENQTFTMVALPPIPIQYSKIYSGLPVPYLYAFSLTVRSLVPITLNICTNLPSSSICNQPSKLSGSIFGPTSSGHTDYIDQVPFPLAPGLLNTQTTSVELPHAN